MRTARWTAILAFAWFGGVVAAADNYPSRPIRLIVTFPPGGSADVMARAIQPHLEHELGQPVVIENRTGAGGVTGIEAVARSAPDGYTIGIGAAGALAVNLSLKEKMPYDPFTELAPISGLAKTPFLLAAAPNFAPDAVKDVIALAKRQPGAIAIGHGGNGTAMHLTAQLFAHMAGVAVTLVPYRGTGPATQDLVAGHIPLAITDVPTAVSLIQTKQIKVLAVTSRERFEAVPDLPTMEEAGLPGYESIGWFGFVAPAATPKEIIARLNAAIVTALKDPAMLERTRTLGAIPMPFSPAEFARYIRSEYEKWAAVVAQTGAKEP
ncbi:MAG TPA: tripartite tricarboxylate transporter substrate binding protein [Xanthobacteraceae bacterium]|nr:tripartite tricarboxylate transporter substrate binding protein [Xanthobacteraceae bacterium]